MTVTDRNGINIEVGFYVKVISLDPADFGHLEKTSLSEVMSMIGEVLEVYEVDEYGQAWVTKEWWLSGDEMIAHSVGLSSHEMEVQTGCS
ncbi:hypothetical protein [Pseudoteredinibacter isoporae]|uniref:Uncharacterized protein n=1 Tax=Pseudoteredinibacter isoporae TaxID=570281 RepID=A0A7X0JX98_9GAMM|nr:hypothetical protein [Pseudoteredinibacter isoporae]MBB6522966.1 hypothetical protein [Pseudoteredinibacter isoporae]NHO88490.1 hypothetical protein [Pseudoteredinibacter isoporae]NIB22111.1 hypothetical protein [Pseudoteredinibacter isoporae]